jgi:3-dehydroquinate synthase
MFETFKIQSSSGSYDVELGAGQFTSNPTFTPCEFSLIDANVIQIWPLLKDCAYTVHPILAIEENKTLSKCAELIEVLRSHGANRSTSFYAYGGGIIQDLATFTASVYMRGIDWTYVPTTLLGMVDSCIGGKSSINVGPFKNIAGNYFPPKKIIIDINFCKTLELPELLAGLCEAVKICFAADGEQFDHYLDLFANKNGFLGDDQLLSVVSLSLSTKKHFIEADEFDLGPRLLLNFGHTFGHAVEAATHFRITHGIAVGMGMLAEIELAKYMGILSRESSRVEKLRGHIFDLLRQIPGMTKNIQTLDFETAVRAFEADKKHRKDVYVVILPNDQGLLERFSLPINSQTDSMVLKVFEWLKNDRNW